MKKNPFSVISLLAISLAPIHACKHTSGSDLANDRGEFAAISDRDSKFDKLKRFYFDLRDSVVQIYDLSSTVSEIRNAMDRIENFSQMRDIEAMKQAITQVIDATIKQASQEMESLSARRVQLFQALRSEGYRFRDINAYASNFDKAQLQLAEAGRFAITELSKFKADLGSLELSIVWDRYTRRHRGAASASLADAVKYYIQDEYFNGAFLKNMNIKYMDAGFDANLALRDVAYLFGDVTEQQITVLEKMPGSKYHERSSALFKVDKVASSASEALQNCKNLGAGWDMVDYYDLVKGQTIWDLANDFRNTNNSLGGGFWKAFDQENSKGAVSAIWIAESKESDSRGKFRVFRTSAHTSPAFIFDRVPAYEQSLVWPREALIGSVFGSFEQMSTELIETSNNLLDHQIWQYDNRTWKFQRGSYSYRGYKTSPLLTRDYFWNTDSKRASKEKFVTVCVMRADEVAKSLGKFSESGSGNDPQAEAGASRRPITDPCLKIAADEYCEISEDSKMRVFKYAGMKPGIDLIQAPFGCSESSENAIENLRFSIVESDSVTEAIRNRLTNETTNPAFATAIRGKPFGCFHRRSGQCAVKEFAGQLQRVSFSS